MKVKTTEGHEVEISMEEAKRIYATVAGFTPGDEKVKRLLHNALKELKEATGDFPENLSDLYEFAVKHKMFGNREETHIYCNFFKAMFALLQKGVH